MVVMAGLFASFPNNDNVSIVLLSRIFNGNTQLSDSTAISAGSFAHTPEVKLPETASPWTRIIGHYYQVSSRGFQNTSEDPVSIPASWAQPPAPQTKGQEKGKSTRWPRVMFAWAIRENQWFPPRAASYSQFLKELLSVSQGQSSLPDQARAFPMDSSYPSLSWTLGQHLCWPWIKPPLFPEKPRDVWTYSDDGKHLPPWRDFFFPWVRKDLVSWQLRSILLGVASLLSKQNRACDCKGRLWASAPPHALASKTYLWGFIKCK